MPKKWSIKDFAQIGLLLFVAVYTINVSCYSSPPEPPPAVVKAPRAEPLAFWLFEEPAGSIKGGTEASRYLFPQAYIIQGEEITLPIEWRAFPFLAPKRGVIVAYEFQWAAPDSAYKTLAIATVDSMAAGVVWIVAKGIEDADRVRLILPWEGYDK